MLMVIVMMIMVIMIMTIIIIVLISKTMRMITIMKMTMSITSSTTIIPMCNNASKSWFCGFLVFLLFICFFRLGPTSSYHDNHYTPTCLYDLTRIKRSSPLYSLLKYIYIYIYIYIHITHTHIYIYIYIHTYTYISLSGSKVHGVYMGPTWGRHDPGGPHAGPMILVIWVKGRVPLLLSTTFWLLRVTGLEVTAWKEIKKNAEYTQGNCLFPCHSDGLWTSLKEVVKYYLFLTAP